MGFKCDYRAEWRGRKAILALIIRRSGGVAKMDIEDLEEDYAVRQVVAINSAPRDFHISIDGAFDGHLFQHPCRHVRVLGSDAATKEAKTLLKFML